MNKPTQEQAEAICKWLGMEVVLGEVVVMACSDNVVTEDCIDFLSDDSGTVAMIEKLRRYSAMARACLAQAIKSDDLNAALIAACLEVLSND